MFARHRGHHEVVAVLDPLFEQGIGDAAIHFNGVPVHLAHVVAGLHCRVAFAQFNGHFRVTLEVDACKEINVGKGEHLARDFENKGHMVKRKGFFSGRQ